MECTSKLFITINISVPHMKTVCFEVEAVLQLLPHKRHKPASKSRLKFLCCEISSFSSVVKETGQICVGVLMVSNFTSPADSHFLQHSPITKNRWNCDTQMRICKQYFKHLPRSLRDAPILGYRPIINGREVLAHKNNNRRLDSETVVVAPEKQ
jgi:hypothetical protein